MEAKEIVERLKQAFPEAIVAANPQAIDPFVEVKASNLLEVLSFLRDAPDLRFDFLMCITGVDLLGLEEPPGFRVLYHLFSYCFKHTLVVKVQLPRENPRVPSAASLYPTAIWHERETFDLLGIVFDGHPDLRRILLPEEWDGHPLRKDYKEGDTALGYPTRRETLMDLIRAASSQKGE